MSIRKRIDTLGGKLDRTGSPPWVRALSDEQLLAELKWLDADLRRGRTHSAVVGEPRAAVASMTDDEVLERLAEAEAALAREGRTT